MTAQFAQFAMPQQELPPLRVYRFYKVYKQAYETYKHTNPITGEEEFRARKLPGQHREVHMVEYGPLASDKLVLTEEVKRLMAVQDPEQIAGAGRNNPAIGMAAARWAVIGPQYERWLAGHSVDTVDGTPLAAWPGLTQEQAELLRHKGLRTVQELARLNDTHFQNLGIPGLRSLVDGAKRFLAALENSHVEDALAEKDEQIAALTEQLGELKALVHNAMALQAQPPAAGAVPAAPAGENDPGFDAPPGFVDPTSDDSGDGGHSDQTVNNAAQLAPAAQAPRRRR